MNVNNGGIDGVLVLIFAPVAFFLFALLRRAAEENIGLFSFKILPFDSTG